ncbi:MAG: bioA [Mycobacterium sp.]|jgi:adenosylmethionine-8-amino-7-oxononanoate aminotransferase|nr:bioA [Mycobacterium sp.]
MTDLVARDLSAVWHPFTQHSLWEEDEPLVIDRAEGMHLIDTDGRRYLDGVSSLWVSVHGHTVPEIDEAVRAQLAKVAHTTFLGLTHEPGIALAEQLLELAPRPAAGSESKPLRKVFYAGDGSSAVEASLKMAYQAASQRGEHRPLFVCVAEGYHGDTLGAVSVGGIDTFHAAYRQILLRTRHIPSPYRVGTAASLQALEELLEREGDQVCAVIIEPMVQAAAGMLTHDADFVRGVRTLSLQAGALMIADEVATGVGRTGEMWAVQHAGVVPDLLTCGKGLSGGYLPISAVLATEEIYESFLGSPESDRTFFHGHTYTANPLACAAALANLKLMAERETVRHAASVGERLGALLAPLSGMAGVNEVRRIGTMTGIEVASRSSRTGFEICRLARRRGVLLRPLSDVVVLMPPLAIGDEDLDELAAVTVDCVHEVVGD